MTDKIQLAGEIAQMEMRAKQLERDIANAKGTVTGAAIGLLVGIILLIVFWPLGLLLCIAGALAYFTGRAKKSTAENEIKNLESKLASAKGQLAAM